ncbi:aminotransferase class V-fold PLP-dependent enzyme [Vannielia litorea]|uniref:cysteine desulfurase family protein n=1 Tax=Vannielia litorea TaxID=1217970 RepID=UPI001C97A72C|nr:aminotransferase class V-fold PLP-dependent enzyme [Vannielia litorea]MBY6152605.1 aminotransferase class V-fold PLP-dependent enzyme [Vannielia litorea]
MSRSYLDFNATAPLVPEARAAMLQAMEIVGNPSSVHAEGRAAKAAVERARAQVAAAVGCKPQEVVFTGGATEAAQVLSGGAVVEPTAHDALWAHNAPEGRIYAMGLANSETGVISEVPEQRPCELLLLDVTQAIGRIPFAFGWSGADLAVLSAHKLGGPKGVGALIVREGLDIAPLLKGGGQEMGRRSGTENVIGIAGFGAAVEAAEKRLAAGDWARVAKARDTLEALVAEAAPETIFIGQEAKRLPNTSCFAAPGWKGETQVMSMDLAGFAISAGSACSSGKVKESRVLRAMGFDEAIARSAIRVSLGPDTAEEDIARFAESWAAAHRKHQARVA